MAEKRDVPLLILDLDGTVRHGKDESGRFVNGPRDVVIFPAAVERMATWQDAGGRIVGITNQGGIALGHVTVRDVEDAILETNRQTEMRFATIRYCPHFPSVRQCWCRKPRPGLVLEAIANLESRWPGDQYPPEMAMVVGDRQEDIGLAVALDVRFMDAADWRGDGEAKAM
jgi:D-glycero-D-manno-heptose 1,7-bisphosphate phosphatase